MAKSLTHSQVIQLMKAGKVLACPSCRKRVDIARCYKKTHWICHLCGTTFPVPYIRSADYFTKEIEKDGKTYRRGNKRKFQPSTIKNRDELLLELKRVYGDPYKQSKRDVRNAAFIAFMFLTGARVTEIVGRSLLDKNKKTVKGQYEVEPIRKFQVNKYKHPDNDSIIWKVTKMPVLKRRLGTTIDHRTGREVFIYPYRDVAVIAEYEKEFLYYIDNWLRMLGDEDILFKFNKTTGWKICYKFNRMYNHYWRHMRMTDLVTNYGFQSLQLKHFAGWSTEKQANIYAHLTTDNLVDAMLLGKRSRLTKIDESKKEPEVAPEEVLTIEEDYDPEFDDEINEPMEDNWIGEN